MFDVAVVTPTILRPSLLRAARSVFAQDFSGRIQFLIGIDAKVHDPSVLDAVKAECPPHVTLTVLDLGYSTSQRHGGFYSNHYGGALRTILSYAANSRHIAYLDDNDWYAGHHLASLRKAIEGHQWAHSYRWLVDVVSGRPICRDEWDAVGPGRGINNADHGGFVQPSELMLDKEACHFVLPLWSLAAYGDGSGEDRLIFRELSTRFSGASSERHTCFCTLTENSLRHDHHVREFRRRGLDWLFDRRLEAQAARLLDEAIGTYRDGRPADAVVRCDEVLRINPHHAPALRVRAQALWRTGRPDEALADIRKALAVDDGDDRASVLLVEFLLRTGNGFEGCRVLDDARRRFPRSAALNALHEHLYLDPDNRFDWTL